jgi:hypothetical protein
MRKPTEMGRRKRIRQVCNQLVQETGWRSDLARSVMEVSMASREDVAHLLEGMRLDAADLRDLARDPEGQRHVRDSLGDLFALHASLRETIKLASPFSEAAE